MDKNTIKEFKKKVDNFKIVANDFEKGLPLAKELKETCIKVFLKDKMIIDNPKFTAEFNKIKGALDLYISNVETLNKFMDKPKIKKDDVKINDKEVLDLNKTKIKEKKIK